MISAPSEAVVVDPAAADDRSAFARGHDAARGVGERGNPYRSGSAEHNNFEVGYRFGTSMSGRAGDIVDAFFHRLD